MGTVGEHQLRLAAGIDADGVVGVGRTLRVESAPDDQPHDQHRRSGCGVACGAEPHSARTIGFQRLYGGCQSGRTGKFGTLEQPVPQGVDIDAGGLRRGAAFGVEVLHTVKELGMRRILGEPCLQQVGLMRRAIAFKIGDKSGFQLGGEFLHRV